MMINGVVVMWILVAAWLGTDKNVVMGVATVYPTEEKCQVAASQQWIKTGADGMNCFRIELRVGPG